MNIIVSLGVRSLYSLVIAFFFMFAVQPVVAAGKYDAEIAVLQRYANDDGKGGWEEECKLKEQFSESLKKLPGDDPVLKAKILAIKDKDGNSLVHTILAAMGHYGTLPADDLSNLFKICGVDVFKVKNSKKLTPFEEYPQHLLKFYNSQWEHRAALESLIQEIAPTFVKSVKALIAEFDAVRKQESSQKVYIESRRPSYQISEELNNVSTGLGVAVRLLGTQFLQGIALEKIDNFMFYREIVGFSEGKKYLREYRVQGKTLYNYFSAQNWRERKNTLSTLLPIYYENGASVPGVDEVDIKAGSEVGYPSKEFFEKYTNSKNQNVAFLVVSSGEKIFVLHNMRREGINVAAMLRAQDANGQSGLARASIKDIADILVDADPDLLINPYFKDNTTTPLIALALSNPDKYLDIKEKLLKKGIKVDQKDAAGNTADSLAQAKREQLERDKKTSSEGDFSPDTSRRFLFDVISKVLNKQPLNSEYWKAAIEHPYARLMYLNVNAGEFINLGLGIALNWNNSPLRSSFLQQSQEKKDQTNQLWRTFLSTYYELSVQEGLESGNNFDILYYYRKVREISLPVRVLIMAKQFKYEGLSPANVEDMQTLQLNILAMGGTFGMDFKRTANADEVEIMVRNLQSLGENLFELKYRFIAFEMLKGRNKVSTELEILPIALRFFKTKIPDFQAPSEDKMKSLTQQDATEILVNNFTSIARLEVVDDIIKRLFQTIPNLGNEEKWKLEDHQTNCAVMALASVFKERYGNVIDFNGIDRVLENRPLMKNKGAKYYRSSQQRYDKVMEMTGRRYKEEDF
jgi:hypothetical protein